MKDIPGYEGLYSISKDGDIFSYRKQKFLKPSDDHKGYLIVTLTSADGTRKNYTIHRLVALTYIPNPDNLPVIDHIDRNKLNNSIENLRWATYQENILNKDLEANVEHLQKIRQDAVQVTSKPVEMRDKNNHDILIKTYPSCRQAARQVFGNASGISQCACGKQKSAYGYFWTYANPDASCEEET